MSRPAKLVRLAAVLAVCLLLPACKTKVTKANLEKIKEGMTLAEVEQVLGKGTKDTGDDRLVAWSSRGVTQDGFAKPDLLAPGAHINAIGANHAYKRELDDEAVASADIIIVDSVEQSRQEAGDLIIAFHGDEICWTGVKKLSEIVAGKASGRTSDTEVTLFKSNGIASWDLAVAMKVYAMARENKLGRELPLWSDGAKS